MSVDAFSLEKVGLTELLKEGVIGKSQLPELQRCWGWADRNIARLIASISLEYPVGRIMTLRAGGPIKFKERPVEAVGLQKSEAPKTLGAARLLASRQGQR